MRDLEGELAEVGAQLRRGRADWAEIKDRARQVAAEAVAAGVPTAEVARRLGISRNTVGIWVRG